MPTPIPSEPLYVWNPSYSQSEPVGLGERNTGWIGKTIPRGRFNGLLNNITSYLNLSLARAGTPPTSTMFRTGYMSWQGTKLVPDPATAGGETWMASVMQKGTSPGTGTMVDLGGGDEGSLYFQDQTSTPINVWKNIEVPRGTTLTTVNITYNRPTNGVGDIEMILYKKHHLTGASVAVGSATSTAGVAGTGVLSITGLTENGGPSEPSYALRVLVKNTGATGFTIHNGWTTRFEPTPTLYVTDAITHTNPVLPVRFQRFTFDSGGVYCTMPIPSGVGIDSATASVTALGGGGNYTVAFHIVDNDVITSAASYTGNTPGNHSLTVTQTGPWSNTSLLVFSITPPASPLGYVEIGDITINFTQP